MRVQKDRKWEENQMNHAGTVTLETERLKLRALVPEDVTAMFDNWAKEEEVTKFLTWPTHTSAEVTKEVLNSWMKEYGKKDFYQWGIELRAIKQVVGTISVVHIKEDIKEVEIGYCIGSKFWNQGIMSEALKEIMRFFFEEVKVNRITARHDTNNPNSGHVMRACGLKFEGIHLQGDINNTGVCDVAVYGLVADDYIWIKSQ